MAVCVCSSFPYSGFEYPETMTIRMIQMQAILIELIDNFEFSPPPGKVEIIRAFAGHMTPM